MSDYPLLFSSAGLKWLRLKNRVCVPPMLCFNWCDGQGLICDKNVEHYRAIAAGGPGLIIQEATCVSPRGRIDKSQPGIWDDRHVPGLRRITGAVHQEGCPILVQIHHSGGITVDEPKLGPSDYLRIKNGQEYRARAMSEAEIETVRQQFIDAGRRAYEAGYDGVELHGCHEYLLCQFFNRKVNRRQDRYGQKPWLLAEEILRGIREVTPESFIIGLRLGGFEPTLADAVENARRMTQAGIDFLDISYGYLPEQELEGPDGAAVVPGDWPFKEIIYAAAEIKKAVDVPVFAVNTIQSPAQAEAVLEKTGVDMVDIGRGILVNYNWVKDAEAGRDTGRCLLCPGCAWRGAIPACPGKRLLERNKTEPRK